MKIIKKQMRIIPSILVMLEKESPSISMSFASVPSTTAANRLNGISFITVFFFAVRGYIIAARPSIKSMFAMLLPKIFPIAISVFPFMLANILTINSGADVPKATMVRPITMFEIFNFFATDADPLTNKSAPFISIKKPTMNNAYVIIEFVYDVYMARSLLQKF